MEHQTQPTQPYLPMLLVTALGMGDEYLRNGECRRVIAANEAFRCMAVTYTGPYGVGIDIIPSNTSVPMLYLSSE